MRGSTKDQEQIMTKTSALTSRWPKLCFHTQSGSLWLERLAGCFSFSSRCEGPWSAKVTSSTTWRWSCLTSAWSETLQAIRMSKTHSCFWRLFSASSRTISGFYWALSAFSSVKSLSASSRRFYILEAARHSMTHLQTLYWKFCGSFLFCYPATFWWGKLVCGMLNCRCK